VSAVCPACGSRRFQDYRKRANAQCARCGSLERHRSFALLLLAECGAPARILVATNAKCLHEMSTALDLGWTLCDEDALLGGRVEGAYDLVVLVDVGA
jgi:hypothetical protein